MPPGGLPVFLRLSIASLRLRRPLPPLAQEAISSPARLRQHREIRDSAETDRPARFCPKDRNERVSRRENTQAKSRVANLPHRRPFMNRSWQFTRFATTQVGKDIDQLRPKGSSQTTQSSPHEHALALIYKIEHRRDVIGTLKRYIGRQARPEPTLRALVLAHIFWID